MGLCASSSYEIGPQTVLVMGAEGSGRRTFLKQCRVMLGRFSTAERREHLRLIHRLLVRHMRRAVQRAESKGALRPEVDAPARYVAEKLSESIAIDRRGADHLAVLWDDAYLKHSVQTADPAMSHLFDKLDDVVSSGYLPSNLDLMHVGAVTQGFSMRNRAAYARPLHAHVLRLVKARVAAAGDRLPADMRQRADLLANVVREEDAIDVELASHIRSLWRCPAFRNAVAGDSAHRFMERIRDISHSGWVPTDEDILYVSDPRLDARQYTHEGEDTGMTWVFRVHEPGAVGAEATAAAASCLVYLVDLSTYRRPGGDGDDGGRPPLLDALDEFERLMSSPPFESVPVALVFTKYDLMALHLEREPLDTCFPDYVERVDGVICSTPAESAAQYVMDRFQEKEAAMQLVSHHVVTTTDTDAVHAVWSSVQDVVLRVAYEKSR